MKTFIKVFFHIIHILDFIKIALYRYEKFYRFNQRNRNAPILNEELNNLHPY
jgi:hypothetical protein